MLCEIVVSFHVSSDSDVVSNFQRGPGDESRLTILMAWNVGEGNYLIWMELRRKSMPPRSNLEQGNTESAEN